MVTKLDRLVHFVVHLGALLDTLAGEGVALRVACLGVDRGTPAEDGSVVVDGHDGPQTGDQKARRRIRCRMKERAAQSAKWPQCSFDRTDRVRCGRSSIRRRRVHSSCTRNDLCQDRRPSVTAQSLMHRAQASRRRRSPSAGWPDAIRFCRTAPVGVGDPDRF